MRWTGYVAHMDGTRMRTLFSLENLKERACLIDLGIVVAVSLFSDWVPPPIGLNDHPARNLLV
jgi:hypothetical protein